MGIAAAAVAAKAGLILSNNCEILRNEAIYTNRGYDFSGYLHTVQVYRIKHKPFRLRGYSLSLVQPYGKLDETCGVMESGSSMHKLGRMPMPHTSPLQEPLQRPAINVAIYPKGIDRLCGLAAPDRAISVLRTKTAVVLRTRASPCCASWAGRIAKSELFS